MTYASTIILSDCAFLESPRYRHDRLWVSDFHTHRVLSCRADGSDMQVEARVPNRPSGLGWLPDGRLLVVSMLEGKLLRREADGTLVTHADLSAHIGGPLNDMLVDDQGRAYVGNFGFDMDNGAPVETANLLRVDPDGSISVAASGLHFPNGMALVGGRLLVSETAGNRISAFPVHADGTLGARQDWASFGPVPTSRNFGDLVTQLSVAPDGMCADSEGAVWVADALGNRVIRVREGGEIVDSVTNDVGTYACALGGADGRTLYMCTAPSFIVAEREGTLDAKIMAVTVDVPA